MTLSPNTGREGPVSRNCRDRARSGHPLYEAQASGLGNAFLIEVLSAADRIVRFPEGWHPLGEGVRRCRLSRFPYALIYSIDTGEILVLAVAHLHRRPDYWRDRLKR